MSRLDTHTTNQGCTFHVLRTLLNEKVRIRITSKTAIVNKTINLEVSAAAVRQGEIRHPYHIHVDDYGWIGKGEQTATGKDRNIYDKWRGIIRYRGTEGAVCNTLSTYFRNYQNFASWFKEKCFIAGIDTKDATVISNNYHEAFRTDVLDVDNACIVHRKVYNLINIANKKGTLPMFTRQHVDGSIGYAVQFDGNISTGRKTGKGTNRLELLTTMYNKALDAAVDNALTIVNGGMFGRLPSGVEFALNHYDIYVNKHVTRKRGWHYKRTVEGVFELDECICNAKALKTVTEF